MATTRFEWGDAQNRSNQRKHGLSFAEAAQAFRDPPYVSIFERIDDGEERWQRFGLVGKFLLLMVAHTIQENETEEVIRIISARPATATNRRRYEDGNS